MEIYKPEPEKPPVFLKPVKDIVDNHPYLSAWLVQLEDIGGSGDTWRHTQRVSNLGYLLARQVAQKGRYGNEYIELFVEACLLHDIGKVEIPLKHLAIPSGQFTPDDLKHIEPHALNSYLQLKFDGISPRV
jgi:response regulator RpfG family c-di-GMP phosphodiesterase